MKPGDPAEAKARPGLGGWLPVTLKARLPRGGYLVQFRSGEEAELPSSRVRATRTKDRPRPGVQYEARPSTPPTYDRPPTADPQPKTPPIRDSAYLAYVRKHACVGCSSPPPNDPHHWGPRGIGQKADDTTCVALCRPCHDQFHRNATIAGHDTKTTKIAFLRAQLELRAAWRSS